MRESVRFLLGLACTAALLASSASGAHAQSTEDREVVELWFEGNEAFSQKDLRAAILTRPTHCRTFLFKFPLPLCPLTNWGFAHVREYLDERELPLDLLRLRLFYRQRGFRDAHVDTLVQRENGTVRIEFHIEENDPTRIATLALTGGEDVVERAEARKDLGVAEGHRLDLVALGQGERKITERLRRKGYVNATVLREYFIPRQIREADVTLRIEPGPRVRIGDITIEGSGDVGDETVGELLTFASGDWFEEERILESQRSLYGLEALRWANIASERRTDTDTVIDLKVQVATAPKQSIRTGFGVYTDECMQLQAQYVNRNFLGAARVLRVTGRVSNLFAKQLQGAFPCSDVSETEVYQALNYLAQVGFEQPVFSHGRNRLRISVFRERETVPDLYVRTGSGGEIAFNRRLTPRMSLTVGYRPELTSFAEESADIYFCVAFGICTPEDIEVLTDAKWLSPVSLVWGFDETNSPFSATRGYYVAFELEDAGQYTLSDYRYTRGTVDAAFFDQLGARGVLGVHVRAGVIAPRSGSAFSEGASGEAVVHPRKRFFAGGPQSVRGFGLNLLGPTVLVLDVARCPPDGASLEECALGLPPTAFDERPVGGNAVFEGSVEARLRVGGRWTMAGFLDFGQVWRNVDDRSAIVATPGIGFRWASPVGPLRFDFGYNPTSPGDRQVVAVAEDGSIQELDTTVLYDPFTYDQPSLATEIFRRIRLQLSLGEAF